MSLYNFRRRLRKSFPKILLVLILLNCAIWLRTAFFKKTRKPNESRLIPLNADMALFKARQKQVKLDEGGDNALENGAIVYYFPSKSAHTTQNIKKICRSLRHLYHHFNNHAMYPVYIFMDQFSRDIQTELLMELTFPSSNELNHLDRLKNAHSIFFFPINLDVPNSEIHPKPLYTKNYPADNNLDLLYFGNLYNVIFNF